MHPAYRLPLAVAVLVLATWAAPAMAGSPKVACPEGQKPLMTQVDYDLATTAYQHGPDELDAPPGFAAPIHVPDPDFIGTWRNGHSLPMRGQARAVVLMREDGGVDAVLVPCATSKKAVAPIVAALKNAIATVPTRDGVAVKSMFVVPVNWQID